MSTWIILFLTFSLYACGTDKQTNNEDNENKGGHVKIITLSPHLAELVYSAGAMDNLIAVVAYSDFPAEVKSIELVGDAFKLDYEKIIALKPDYILTWKGGTPIAVLEKLKSLNLTTIETEINTLADIPETIAQIAKLTQTQDHADIAIDLFNNTLAKIQSKKYSKTTAFIETYHQPLYTVSGKHWISEAVSVCGYENVFADLPQSSVPVTLESVILKNPQAIINIAKQADKQWLKWQNLLAVKNNQIITIDPDIISRPSMRILEGIKQLCTNNI